MPNSRPASTGIPRNDKDVRVTEPAPAFLVTRGRPTDEELAALTAVLLAAVAAPTAPGSPPRRVEHRSTYLSPRSWRAGGDQARMPSISASRNMSATWSGVSSPSGSSQR